MKNKIKAGDMKNEWKAEEPRVKECTLTLPGRTRLQEDGIQKGPGNSFLRVLLLLFVLLGDGS